MRVVALILILLGGAALLPPVRELVPRIHLDANTWQWVGFGAIAIAALVYFLAPKD